MEATLNKLKGFILNGGHGVPVESVLFLLFYFERILLLLIGNNVFALFSDHQHEVLLLEKYTCLCVIGWIILRWITGCIDQKKFNASKGTVLAVLLAGTAVVSTVFNMGQALAYDYFVKLGLLEVLSDTLFVFHISSCMNEKQFERLFEWTAKGTIALILFMNLISLAVYFIQPSAESIVVFGRAVTLPKCYVDPAEFRKYTRYNGFYAHANTLGPHNYIAFIVSVCLLSKRKMNRWVFFVLLASGLYLIYLSHSRTSYVVLTFIALYSLLLYMHRKHRDKRKTSALILAMILIAFAAAGLLEKNTLRTFTELFAQSPYVAFNALTSARIDVWTDAINKFLSSPLIGVGWNVPFVAGANTAHNIFLTVLAWTGICGTAVFAAILITAWQKGRARRLFSKEPWYLCLVLSVLLQCMTEQGILGDSRHVYTYLFWLLLGYFALPHRAEN